LSSLPSARTVEAPNEVGLTGSYDRNPSRATNADVERQGRTSESVRLGHAAFGNGRVLALVAGVRAPIEIVRMIKPLQGHPLLRVDFDPRPDYARARVVLRETDTVGSAASGQRRNDLVGEVILALETLLGDPRIVLGAPESYFPLIRRLVEQSIETAGQPDTGIWECRSMLRPYTFSRAMCWVAIERGARLALRFGEAELARRWEGIARAERAAVLKRGFNGSIGFFTQALDGEHPDASNLLLPTLGIIEATDPRFLSTITAYEERLVDNGPMLRYRNPDDSGESTTAFRICSFWWAEALALAGRLDDAVTVFERASGCANPAGLSSEDVDPAAGLLLGNFPQAYTHVGLLNVAMTIGSLLEARDGRNRAWI